MADDGLRPRTYYLNEQHELTREEKTGGGGSLKLAPIDWASKGRAIRDSLSDAKDTITRSRDPLKKHRFFLLAQPVAELIKESKQKKRAPEGTYAEKPNYASGEHSRVFQRLGLDLLQVNDDGSATVHATAEGMDKLLLASESLDEVGTREQSRWATIDTFGVIPPGLRIDETWLDDLSVREAADAVLELQPLLTRAEIDEVVRAVASFLKHDLGEKLTGTGTDFSGRQWFRGRVAKQSLRAIARHFYSVQSVHPPLLSLAAVANGGRRGQHAPLPPQIRTAASPPLMDMPTVAIVDTGVPDDHRILVPFRRGRYVDQQSAGRWVGDHGSFVASRIVFGDIDSPERRSPAPGGECRFYEVMVAIDAENIEDKSVVPSMEAVVGTAPDVRVFNLSFDNRLPLDALSEIVRREKLLLLQDLDNFIFARDVLVVVSAGNSPPGVIPSSPYPQHGDDPQWQLGTWARSFNALTCGSTVERLVPSGLVRNIGWPSPFTRVGPGSCDSPKPDFCAHGGNGTDAYQFSPGLGVYGCSASGLWEDRSGTSFAAPMLAREAAFALQILQGVCEAGARPFAATVKAFLALTATRPNLDAHVMPLARRALGLGKASAERLRNPFALSAVMLWQGIIDSPNDIVRVQMPIPKAWIESAGSPQMRLVVSWDAPVNAAAHDVWASRKLTAHLLPRPRPEGKALHGSRRSHKSYPLLDRIYDLSQVRDGVRVEGDMWLLELSYAQTADYYPAITFAPQQRVAIAAELFDSGVAPVSPQAALQSLPITQTMQRLSVAPAAIKTPVILRSRI